LGVSNSKQANKQSNKQNTHQKNQNKQTRVMQFDSFFFSTIGSGGSNTLFFCTCFPNLLYYIQLRLNRKAARVDNFHLMTEAFNKAAHPKRFGLGYALLPRLKFMYKTFFLRKVALTN